MNEHNFLCERTLSPHVQQTFSMTQNHHNSASCVDSPHSLPWKKTTSIHFTTNANPHIAPPATPSPLFCFARYHPPAIQVSRPQFNHTLAAQRFRARTCNQWSIVLTIHRSQYAHLRSTNMAIPYKGPPLSFFSYPAQTPSAPHRSAPSDCVHLLVTTPHNASKLSPRSQPLHRDGAQLVQPWLHIPPTRLCHMRYNFFKRLPKRLHLSHTWRKYYPL